MIAKVTAGLSLVALVVGGTVGLHKHLEANYAKKEKLKLTNCRLEQKILDDRLNNAREELFWYEQKYGDGCQNADARTKLKCDETEARIEKTQKELDKLPSIPVEGY